MAEQIERLKELVRFLLPGAHPSTRIQAEEKHSAAIEDALIRQEDQGRG